MDWLKAFDPDPEDLLDKLLPQIDDGMLREVSEADYGSDADRHFPPLKQFRDARVVPTLDWHPAEVLELIRWSQPDEPGWRPGSEGRRGHFLRAFACAALLVAYPAPHNHDKDWISFNETAIQLADSLVALDDGLIECGTRFFAWCIETVAPLDSDGIETPFFGLALLSLATKQPGIDDKAIVDLCQWIDRRVTELLKEKQWWATRRKDWLLSTNHHNLKNERWLELGRELYRQAEGQGPGERAAWVALIGRALAEE